MRVVTAAPEPVMAHSAAPALEPHYSPKEVAEAWGLNERTIRDLFRDEPGVLKIGQTGRRGRRDYTTLRIPESVLNRMYHRRCR